MEAWNNFLSLQEAELGSETVNKWLRSLKVLRFDAGNLYLQAQDSFQIIWFEEHVRSKVQSFLYNNNRRRINVHLSLDGAPPKIKKKPGAKEVEAVPPSRFTIGFDSLDPNCTLDNFIPSTSQPLAFKLLCQMTGYSQELQKTLPGRTALGSFNPIYLYGDGGTGKTHLLMATGKALIQQGFKVAYVRAETFTEHVVTAIRAGEMSLFRQSYRNTDVLMIDDVHLFANKWATQEELFHTFNTLHMSGKQILLSANCLPNELEFVEPRLISRFEWGIVLPIERLQKEELAKMLAQKASALSYDIREKVTDFLLETFSSGPKALCKALEALVLRTHLNQNGVHLTPTQISVPFVQHHLSDLIAEEQRGALNPEMIIQQAAEFFGIRSEDILGKTQSRDCVLPRQIAMYLCRTKLKMPFTKIGELFSKDHSTVISSVKLVQKGVDGNNVDISGPLHAILKHVRN